MEDILLHNVIGHDVACRLIIGLKANILYRRSHFSILYYIALLDTFGHVADDGIGYSRCQLPLLK